MVSKKQVFLSLKSPFFSKLAPFFKGAMVGLLTLVPLFVVVLSADLIILILALCLLVAFTILILIFTGKVSGKRFYLKFAEFLSGFLIFGLLTQVLVFVGLIVLLGMALVRH